MVLATFAPKTTLFQAFFKNEREVRLSSVPIPNERIGNEAAELLSMLMDGKMGVRHETQVSPETVAARYSTEGPVTTEVCVLMAITFIRENACKGINTEDVLDHLSRNAHLISRSTLERRFRAALRHSPKDEILRVRIARAGELLMTTTYPLSKIAEMVSIQRPEHLSATFKRLTGHLPGELRGNGGKL
ncbi:MAG: helix-turn-helix domain-containing protein [Phycisphaerae bacterium]